MSYQPEKIISERKLRLRTIISFAGFILFFLSCFFIWKRIHQQPEEAGLVKPLRKVLDANETIFAGIFPANNLSAGYKRSVVVPRARVNGADGLQEPLDTANWKLHVVKDSGDTLSITLDEIKALPKTEVIFDFKCIEGWSQVTHWGGVKFSDFIKKYGLQKLSKMKYTGMQTPDGKYYVGIDMKSMMHPQTILCYEINGKPLPLNQGYPLRLIIPVKYGVKHLKRIGSVYFANERPKDFWYERGYDYYCGL